MSETETLGIRSLCTFYFTNIQLCRDLQYHWLCLYQKVGFSDHSRVKNFWSWIKIHVADSVVMSILYLSNQMQNAIPNFLWLAKESFLQDSQTKILTFNAIWIMNFTSALIMAKIKLCIGVDPKNHTKQQKFFPSTVKQQRIPCRC